MRGCVCNRSGGPTTGEAGGVDEGGREVRECVCNRSGGPTTGEAGGVDEGREGGVRVGVWTISVSTVDHDSSVLCVTAQCATNSGAPKERRNQGMPEQI